MFGFACKFSHIVNNEVVPIPELNCKTTTRAWMSRQSKSVQHEKLLDLIKHNIESVRQSVIAVSKLPANQHLFRISSDILPLYCLPEYKDFYNSSEVQKYMQHHLAIIGNYSRLHNIRLSFHPGQYVCFASENPNIVQNSIAEFEYHVDMIRMMGYGSKFQDFKCNIHCSGKLGIDGFRNTFQQLSVEAKNVITVENAEYVYGLDECLELADLCPIVFDIHHDLLFTKQHRTFDDKIHQVIDSWRGVKPTMHYSQSRSDYLIDHDPNCMPDMETLINSGYKIAKLRAHSDDYWNVAQNIWLKQYIPHFDILCEVKSKNLAVTKLLESLC